MRSETRTAAGAASVAVVFADDNGAASSDLVNSLAPNEDALVAAVAQAFGVGIYSLGMRFHGMTHWPGRQGMDRELVGRQHGQSCGTDRVSQVGTGENVKRLGEDRGDQSVPIRAARPSSDQRHGGFFALSICQQVLSLPERECHPLSNA